ncbi:MAG: flagellin, partial [Thermoguttaceae bacterium]
MSTIYNPVNLKVNVSSLIGRFTLSQTNDSLSKSLRNLSTGIRIESGRDDPVGFVAATAMRTDITSLSQAVSNCQRASAVIATADGALSSVNNLLNDLKGFVTQAASTGGENDATIAAMQIEVDAILGVIDMISNSTSFQQQKLLDGSLDFTTYGVDSSKISYLDINQVNFLGRTEKDIAVQVIEAGRQAELYYPLGALKTNVAFDLGGSGGYQSFRFDKDASVQNIADEVNRFSDATGVAAKVYSQSTPGSLALTSYGTNNNVIVTASAPGAEAGNFVIKYSVPREGNEGLSLSVSPGNGNEPTAIEVILQTETWQKAAFHYNGDQDGISNNEFTITAKNPGEDFNNIAFSFNNVFGTAQQTGIDIDLKSDPKTFKINVSYNSANPNDPNNTKVTDLEAWIAASPDARNYFELTNTPPSNGTGPLVPTSDFTQTQKGVNGGAVLSTAEQVATLLNTSPLLKNLDGTGRLTATIPSGETGLGIVTPFTEYAFYGNANENNYMQFLGPENSPKIRFVSTPGTPLSVDDRTNPPVLGKASALIQGFDSGTSFSLTARSPGPEWDGVGVLFRDAKDESAIFDPERKAVIISVDFSGRASDPNRDYFSMNDLVNLVSNDPILGSIFTVTPMSNYDTKNPPKFESSNYIGINSRIGETTGGLVSAGELLVHLETDTKGIIKTTANDLVKFFNFPSTEESKSVLDKYGISVSNIDPEHPNLQICTQGLSEKGTGLLKPTFDSNACDPIIGSYPDIRFSSAGAGVSYGFPTATIISQNGIDSGFTISALQSGPGMNNTVVQVVSDYTGPNVTYNSSTKQLSIGVPINKQVSANDIISLINSDLELREIFTAARTPSSTGNGAVAIGDRAVMTGGIKAAEDNPKGYVIS